MPRLNWIMIPFFLNFFLRICNIFYVTFIYVYIFQKIILIKFWKMAKIKSGTHKFLLIWWSHSDGDKEYVWRTYTVHTNIPEKYMMIVWYLTASICKISPSVFVFLSVRLSWAESPKFTVPNVSTPWITIPFLSASNATCSSSFS